MSGSKWEGSIIVFVRYKPREGREADLLELVRRHGPVLVENGLVTDRPFIHGRASDGSVLEVFEWISEDASRSAHDNEAIQAVWGAMAECAEFLAVGELEEMRGPFAHFTPFDP